MLDEPISDGKPYLQGSHDVGQQSNAVGEEDGVSPFYRPSVDVQRDRRADVVCVDNVARHGVAMGEGGEITKEGIVRSSEFA